MADLTPTDIVNKEFNRSLRGYNVDEVDEFLQLASDSLYHTLEENKRLQGQLDEQRARVQQYQQSEETIKEAILMAQRAAEETRAQAAHEGERVRREADDQLRAARAELEELRQTRLRVLAELRAMLNAHISLLETQESRATPAGGNTGHGF